MTTLNKKEIENRIQIGQLIAKNFNKEGIREACYQASTSNDFFAITNNDAKKIVIKNEDSYILRPNNQVVCVTMEYFDIPLDIIARILLIGHYFSIGIAPVNTYADPGFKGRLGIVLTNTSKNYLIIKPNVPLVKVEFSQLLNACETGYVGQHGGDVSIWPFRKDLIATDKYLKEKGINRENNDELELLYGKAIKDTILSVNTTKAFFAFSTTFSSLIPLFIIWFSQQKLDLNSPIFSAIIGIVTGVLGNIIFYSFIRSKNTSK